MIRAAINLLVVALVTFPASGTPAPKPTKDDLVKALLSKLEGTWKTVYCQVDGMETTAMALEKMAPVTCKGSNFSFLGGSQGKISQIDPTASPATIDYETETDNEELKIQLGICKFEGDTFVDCVSLGGRDRPKEFVSKKGSGHILMKYKRVKE